MYQVVLSSLTQRYSSSVLYFQFEDGPSSGIKLLRVKYLYPSSSSRTFIGETFVMLQLPSVSSHHIIILELYVHICQVNC